MTGFIDIDREPIRSKPFTHFTMFFNKANIQCIRIGMGKENSSVISKISEVQYFRYNSRGRKRAINHNILFAVVEMSLKPVKKSLLP